MNWMEYAACKGMNPEAFMPERGDNLKIQAAKKMCHSCPVLFDCRKYGLQMHRAIELHGIFGGLTRMEREDYLRAADGRPPKNRKSVRKTINE